MRTKMILVLAAFSLSIGMGLISGGLGAAVPAIRNIALPVVCQGDVVRESEAFSYKPGQSGISRTTYCVNDDGDRRDITFSLIATAGLVYSAATFAVVFALARLVRRRFAPVAQWQRQET